MNYVIVGAEFVNKGSEAMILTAINEIKLKDSNPHITIFSTVAKVDPDLISDLGVEYFYLSPYLVNDMVCFSFTALKRSVKSIIKKIIKPNSFPQYYANKTCIKRILKANDYLIDLSGFALSSRWGKDNCNYFLNRIKLAKKLNPSCNIYLLPQSFGPLEFDKEYISEIKESLSLCSKIYAREKEGYDLLVSIGLNNVILSLDSVLLEKSIKYDNIFRDFNKFNYFPEKHNSKNIAIIPNVRLFDKTNIDQDSILRFYSEVIDKYKDEYTIWLIPHSNEDCVICEKMKTGYIDCTNVKYIDSVLHSFSYQEMISDFSFIIASRYHSIVHAYKEGTPAVIIGWSVKYDELAKQFCQEKYLVPVTEVKNTGIQIVDDLDVHSVEERRIIQSRLKEIQQNSCYSFLSTNLGA